MHGRYIDVSTATSMCFDFSATQIASITNTTPSKVHIYPNQNRLKYLKAKINKYHIFNY